MLGSPDIEVAIATQSVVCTSEGRMYLCPEHYLQLESNDFLTKVEITDVVMQSREDYADA